MKLSLKRTRGVVDQPEDQNSIDIPKRTKFVLTACDTCKHIAWVGVPIPHVVTSLEPVEQLVRVNQGRGSSKRITVTAPLRLVMSKPKKYRCPDCGNDQVKVAITATQILGLTFLKMRRAL